MKILEYIHQGKRENQEDSKAIAPNIFVVCDGIGGHHAGEIASAFVTSQLAAFFNKKWDLTQALFEEELKQIQLKLNAQLDQYPERSKMGTTLVALVKLDGKWMSAHIGDSRLYHIRPSENKFWHTWDHSLVAYLIRKGHITREEGRNHPRNNEIGRAILANTEGKLVKTECHELSKFKEGDLLLLCSDGVNETWGDEELIHLLCDPYFSLENKLEEIKSRCSTESKDNNTAFFIEIEKDDLEMENELQAIPWLQVFDNNGQIEIGTSQDNKVKKSIGSDSSHSANEEKPYKKRGESYEVIEEMKSNHGDENSGKTKSRFWIFGFLILLFGWISKVLIKKKS